ncbi:endonuclease/exonuclease/phosphatase family protein [Streptomyces sp. NBC_00377]|uniref:endonuclease/exonuclease/phosphatase family protein n=1 Tax=unclassified Streptomyces TaxID=2593676 RepID=UPI002E1D5ABE|nr:MULTISPECIES: endonuclease/exonuclease/phosphatase family protein [unclassified Streptomyces]
MTGSSGSTRRAGLRTMVAAVAAVPLLGTVGASAARHESRTQGTLLPAPAPPLEVMTFNLRFASAKKPNSWAQRRPVMRALLRRAAPHVIGTQEGRPQQLRDIEADLGPHYDWIGTSRAVGDDEAMAVFYDTRRLVPAGYEHFWLSDTPQVRGSNTWGGGHPRMVTWVRFRDLRAAGRQFRVLNTHLDNASEYARVRGAALIAARIARFDPSLPLVVTGDFNTTAQDAPVHDALLAAGLVDTWDTARVRGAAYATFHGYRPLVPDGERIDWILATPGVTVHREWTDPFAVGGQYPSDHLPVQASLSLG